jgi:hypothetical protein
MDELVLGRLVPGQELETFNGQKRLQQVPRSHYGKESIDLVKSFKWEP